jgi:hypothetical protein
MLPFLLVAEMNPETENLGVPDSLKKNLDWYIANQKDLAAKYNGKILLIVDQKLINVFVDMAEAYTEASKSFTAGTFTLQPCSPDPESYSLMLYSPMFSILA